MSKNKPNSLVLEPSIGEGVFWNDLKKYKCRIIGLEIDKDLIPDNSSVKNIDLFEYREKLKQKYDLIIGNPPYVDFEKIYVNYKTRSEEPFFTHGCDNFDGSILCIYFKKGIDVYKHIKKLNNVDCISI